MRKIGKIMVLLWVTCATTGWAQDNRELEPPETELETDRPDNTEAPSVVPKGTVQVETGVLFRQDQNGNVAQKELLYPRMLVRVGLGRKVELRLVGDHRREEQEPVGRNHSPERTQGLNAFTIGTKIRLLEGQGVVPDVAFLGHVTLPWGSSPWVPLKIAPMVRLAFGHNVTESLQIQYNLGWEREWEDGQVEGQGVYTLSAQQELTDGIKTFLEVFGNKAGGEPFELNLDGGFLFMVRPNLQLDIWGGIGLSSNAPDFFLGTGVSFRLPH
jgi:hypothetical protein